jgi:hypothetical protein
MRVPTAFGILHFAFGVAPLENARCHPPTDNRRLRADNSEYYWNIASSTCIFLTPLAHLAHFPLAIPPGRFLSACHQIPWPSWPPSAPAKCQTLLSDVRRTAPHGPYYRPNQRNRLPALPPRPRATACHLACPRRARPAHRPAAAFPMHEIAISGLDGLQS